MKRLLLVALGLCSTSLAESHELGDALGEEEAVVRALQANPSLRAFRKQRAIAEGEIVSATALQNPSLRLDLLHVQEGSQMGFGMNLKWMPPQPVEWLAHRSQSRAHLDEVRYEVAEKEWALATLVRTTHSTLVELRDQERLDEAGVALRRRMVGLVRTQVTHGRATRLELNLAELSLLYAQREIDEIQLRQTQAQAQLQALLGLFVAEPIVVKGTAAALEIAALADPAELSERALVARPALKAAQARIIQREQGVRIEKSRRWPWFELSGRYRHAGSLRYPHDVMLSVEVPLPVLNTNAGPLQVALAQRDQEQAAVEAQVQTLKQSIYAACAELKVRAKILNRFSAELLPLLMEHEQLMETALRGAAIDLVALLSSEERVLRGRREHSDARLAYRRAWLTLEAALGFPLQEIDR